MQSSSRLFPVSLTSAELRADLTEDVYCLRPGNSPDRSVEIAITRLGQAKTGPRGRPVILLHGSFSNRRFWYSANGIGLGPYLVEQGFDVWLPEMRGHGLSPKNEHYSRNTLADYARFDLPAINAFIHEVTGVWPHWVGHSLGGTTLAAALAAGYLTSDELASVALFGSQVSRRYGALKIPPVQWLLRAYIKRQPSLAGYKYNKGPEDEPIGLVLESLAMQGLRGRFGGKVGDWWQGLKEVSVPVLAVAARGDAQDPAWACQALLEQIGSEQKAFVCLGKRYGYQSDYGHSEMLISKAAQKEVWPMIAHWLKAGSIEARQLQG